MNYVPDKTIAEMFWTGTSRLNRLRFLKRNLALFGFFMLTFLAIVIALCITTGFKEIDGDTLMQHPAILVSLAVLQVFIIVLSYKLDVRRLKDLGRNNRLALISLVFAIVGFVVTTPPIIWTCDVISGIISLYLLFAPGNKGANAYGPDPLENEV